MVVEGEGFCGELMEVWFEEEGEVGKGVREGLGCVVESGLRGLRSCDIFVIFRYYE